MINLITHNYRAVATGERKRNLNLAKPTSTQICAEDLVLCRIQISFFSTPASGSIVQEQSPAPSSFGVLVQGKLVTDSTEHLDTRDARCRPIKTKSLSPSAKNKYHGARL